MHRVSPIIAATSCLLILGSCALADELESTQVDSKGGDADKSIIRFVVGLGPSDTVSRFGSSLLHVEEEFCKLLPSGHAADYYDPNNDIGNKMLRVLAQVNRLKAELRELESPGSGLTKTQRQQLQGYLLEAKKRKESFYKNFLAAPEGNTENPNPKERPAEQQPPRSGASNYYKERHEVVVGSYSRRPIGSRSEVDCFIRDSCDSLWGFDEGLLDAK